MLRKKNNQIQTPIVRLYNHDINKCVILVGTCHIAEPQYYEKLQKLIDIHENNDCKILFEGIIADEANEDTDDGVAENVGEENISEDSKLTDLMDMFDYLGKLMNLQFQSDGLKIGENWINADLTESEFNKLMDDNNFKIISKKKIDFGKIKDKIKSKEKFAKWFINKFFGLMPLINYFSVRNIFSKKSRLIVSNRNKIAVDGIREYVRTNHVVSIWGSGHIEGIVRLLRKEGFVNYGVEWLTFYNIKKYKLFGE